MKTENESSVTAPLLKEIVELDQAQQSALPKFDNRPGQPADLLHDAGNGYNSNFVFPQE
jgi:hypothetical protein